MSFGCTLVTWGVFKALVAQAIKPASLRVGSRHQYLLKPPLLPSPPLNNSIAAKVLKPLN